MKKKTKKKRVPLKKRLAKAWDEIVYNQMSNFNKAKQSSSFKEFLKAASVK